MAEVAKIIYVCGSFNTNFLLDVDVSVMKIINFRLCIHETYKKLCVKYSRARRSGVRPWPLRSIGGFWPFQPPQTVFLL